MLDNRWATYLYNICLGLNVLLLFLVFFGTAIKVPVFLQVGGRTHPLLLHFPIVLICLSAIWEATKNQRNLNIHHGLGDILLGFSAITCALTALMGLFLAQEGGYDPDLIEWHQWSGVVLSCLVWAWYSLRVLIRGSKGLSNAMAFCAVAATIVTGHKGASITHGDNYLEGPMLSKEQKPIDLEQALVYEQVVKPILQEKCMTCHNNSKSKGDLNMESESWFQNGGKSGKPWDTTALGLGLLIQRIHLPLEVEEHMPPKGKPQLTEEEISLLYHWIKKGSSLQQKVIDLTPTDSLSIAVLPFLKPSTSEEFSFEPASASSIQPLNNDYCAVYPLSKNSPALAVDFFGISGFNSDNLKALKAVSTQIVSLNLNRMPIKDEDLKTISDFPNLRKLNLSNTPITGAALQEISRLDNLQKLSLSGTSLTTNDLYILESLKKLQYLYVWNTAVNLQDLPDLKNRFPNTKIELGFNGDQVIAKLNAAVIEGDQQVFATNTKVKLKNYINGAIVRYTLDGSIPDSLHSNISNGDSLTIDKTCALNTKVFMPGWISSEVSTRHFYKVGFVPDSVRMTHPPNPQYKGEGGKTLVNGKVGDTEFRNNKWLGYRETPLEAIYSFKQPIEASSITISTLVDIGSYIMPADQIEIWGGTQINQLRLLKRLKPPQPTALGKPAYKIGFDCAFSPQRLSIIKVVVKPLRKLPTWHPGKGDPAWVFTDEIFIN